MNNNILFKWFLKVKNHKIFKFIKSPFIILTSFFVLTVTAYFGIVEASHYKFYEKLMTLPQAGNFLVWFIPEFLLFYCLGLLFCNKNKLIRCTFYAGFIVFLLIYLAQAVSVHISNDLISILALENIQFIGIIADKRSLQFSVVAFFIVIIIFIVGMEVFTDKYIKLTKKKFLSLIAVSFILFIYLIFYNFYLFGITNKVSSFFPNRQTPAVSLINNIIKVNSAASANTLNTLDLNMLQKLKLSYNEKARFPFMKKKIFSSPIKYPSIKSKSKPNIIIFFVEGLSARLVSCYGSEFKDLTPNIDAFAKKSLKVDNYYNHTSCTYRGIPGQLCSIYPFHGYDEWTSKKTQKMEKINYSSIPGMLDKRGYDSLFFCAENGSIENLSKMLKFKETYAPKKIIKDLLHGRAKLINDMLTDESLFDALIYYLKKRKKQNTKKPFFISFYNIQTHSFFKTPKNGIKHKKMNNDTLNAIYNFDTQFGKFYKYFKKSTYAKNTIIILTTDHASYYGDPSYRRLISGDKRLFFIDKIPLLIYNPYLKLPKRYDAKMATSINLAPTLFHMLGINNMANNFLGQSLFERTKDYGVGAIGNRFYFIHKNKIYISECKTEELSKIFNTYIEYIKTFYLTESKNRVFSER